MIRGVVFDIREFTLHDGPGLRTTVFLKGCPLRCTWCHNPEGQSAAPQSVDAAGLPRTMGRTYRSSELAALLNRQAAILNDAGGGVTFSGGEPLAQAAFLDDVLDQVGGLHVVLDTSGYAAPSDFRRIAARCHLIHFDLKLMDAAAHRRYTGCDNALILANLRAASDLRRPFVVRIPLVPGVTDTPGNIAAIAEAVDDLPGLVRVDLLPYNRAAGGKYAPLGMRFQPAFDETMEVRIDTAPFHHRGIEVRVVGRKQV